MEHIIKLEESALFFVIETVTVGYCHLARGRFVRTFLGLPESLSDTLIQQGVERSLRETARVMLRQALKDPRFRERLEEHFSNHLHDDIRVVGWPWVAEQLVWESK